ncbi:hypothetical protein VTN00DRAFT_5853 [Thermoascus crustaceus]|uniref:uncharacterized protein n=1 Tax=Thermoascus crustaceus TaxID=5088 RepID=UPI003743E5A5
MKTRPIFAADLRHCASSAASAASRDSSRRVGRDASRISRIPYELHNRRRGNSNGYYSVLCRRRAPGLLLFAASQRSPYLNSTYERPFSCSASHAGVEPDDGNEFDAFDDFDEFNELDDDDDTLSDTIRNDLGAMIRNRHTGKTPQRHLSAQEQLRLMNAAKRPEEVRAQRAERVILERRRIESALSALTPVSALVDEYCTLKYAGLEAELDRCAKLNRELEREYNQFEFALNVATLESKMTFLDESFRELLRELREEFIEPRASARRKVDDILNTIIDLQEHYFQVKDMFQPLIDNYYRIRQDLISLRDKVPDIPPQRQMSYAKHLIAIRRDIREFGSEAHDFRFYHILRKRIESPLGAAWYPRLLRAISSEPHEAKAKSKTFQASIAALISPDYYRKRSSLSSGYVKLTQRFYLKRLRTPQPPRSPKLNIHWRHLDFMAPFELVAASSAALATEVRALHMSLSSSVGDVWSQLDDATRSKYHDRLQKFLIRFGDHRSSFNDQVEILRAINWMRLLSDDRLHALGLPYASRERTVPKPLSQDRKRFVQWTERMNAEIEASKRLQGKVYVLQGQAEELANLGNSKGGLAPEEQQPASEIDVFFDLGSDQTTHPSSKKMPKQRSPVARLLDAADEPRRPRDVVSKPMVAKKRRRRKGRIADSPAVQVHQGLTSSILQPKWRPKSKFDKPNAVRRFGSLSYNFGPAAQRAAENSDIQEPAFQLPSGPEHQQRVFPPVSSAGSSQGPQYWNHNLYKKVPVHYCKNLKDTEKVARYFLDSRVVGFDLEWKASASFMDPIQQQLSLIQLADEERIALFHVALFRPVKTLDDLVSPSLKKVLESPEITKVGVSISGDSTRLKRVLGIEARGLFELSHLYRLVKYSQSNPKLVNKKLVRLTVQVEEHLGLPLYKEGDVRLSDWTRSLNYDQVQYAASDPYACVCLFNVMEAKRKALNPTPPRPSHLELRLPILLADSTVVSEKDDSPGTGQDGGDRRRRRTRKKPAATGDTVEIPASTADTVADTVKEPARAVNTVEKLSSTVDTVEKPATEVETAKKPASTVDTVKKPASKVDTAVSYLQSLVQSALRFFKR